MGGWVAWMGTLNTYQKLRAGHTAGPEELDPTDWFIHSFSLGVVAPYCGCEGMGGYCRSRDAVLKRSPISLNATLSI